MKRLLLVIEDQLNKEAPAGQIVEAQCKEIYLRNIQHHMREEEFVNYAKCCHLIKVGEFDHTTKELKQDYEDYGNLYDLLKRPILESDIIRGAEENEV